MFRKMCLRSFFCLSKSERLVNSPSKLSHIRRGVSFIVFVTNIHFAFQAFSAHLSLICETGSQGNTPLKRARAVAPQFGWTGIRVSVAYPSCIQLCLQTSTQDSLPPLLKGSLCVTANLLPWALRLGTYCYIGYDSQSDSVMESKIIIS